MQIQTQAGKQQNYNDADMLFNNRMSRSSSVTTYCECVVRRTQRIHLSVSAVVSGRPKGKCGRLPQHFWLWL